MATNRTPQWHSITKLPLIAHHIDGMLAADTEQYQTLQKARSQPHILDDHTVNRVIQVFTDQQKDFWVFDEQLKRWKAEPQLTEPQRREIERTIGQMKRLRELNTSILALTDELKEGTIEKIMAKGDLELGLEILQQELKRKTGRTEKRDKS
jgi:hypothetical protein